MQKFLVDSLSPAQIAVAYPLIREVAPKLDLQRWGRFAAWATDPRREPESGVLVVSRPSQPFPCGLVCYRCDHDPVHHAVLTAEYLVAMDLLDSPAALQALILELERRARRLGCHAVRSLLQGTRSPLEAGLLQAGHAREGSILLKLLHPE